MRQLLGRLRLAAMLFVVGSLLSLGVVSKVFAANPPQCASSLSSSGAYDCNHKPDSYPADANGGKFLDDHCYKLQTSSFGLVYFDQASSGGCNQLPFTAGVSNGTGVTSTNGECKPKGSFFGFPTWYKYLPGIIINNNNGDPPTCQPRLDALNDVWLIVAAVVEMLLRVAALAAIAMIVWGGIQYITSQGEPDKTNQARSTIVNALIGLVIAVGAATFVTFVAGRFK